MGDGFQKWKGFLKKKMGTLTTHALPNITNTLNHSTKTITIPKITYTKLLTNIEISILIKPKQK